MGYRQNNPNYQGGGGGNLASILPLILAGHQGVAPQPDLLGRPDINRGPGAGNDSPFVIGGGPGGGSYTEYIPPGQEGMADDLYRLGTGARRYAPGGDVVGLGLPMRAGGGILQLLARLLGHDPNAPEQQGPPEPREVPIPRSVVGDGWDHLFRGDSEFFWNSIQPNARGGMGGGGGGSSAMDPYGAFRGSGGWGALLY